MKPVLPLRRVDAQCSSLAHDGTTIYEEDELAEFSRPRRLVARLVMHPDFEPLVVLAILGNTVTLALYRPTESDGSHWNRGLLWADTAFNALFTAEMLLRIVALGGPLAYLRYPWNVFDAAMVAIGYLAFVPTDDETWVRALRALRALRPLRTITRSEALRAVVVCFLEAVPLLGSAVGLMLLFVFVFAVAGTNLYANVYHQKCYSALTGLPEESRQDPDMLGCGNWRSCPANYTCEVTRRSNAVNIAGFDNVGLAMLTVFQSITLTGWSFTFYRTIDNINPSAAIYYIVLVSIGAYVLVNLFLAVLKIKFAKAQTAFRAGNAARSRVRRNTVVSLFTAAKSKFTQYSAKRSAAHSLNASIATLLHSRMSQYSSIVEAEAGPAANTTLTAAAVEDAKAALGPANVKPAAPSAACSAHDPDGSGRPTSARKLTNGVALARDCDSPAEKAGLGTGAGPVGATSAGAGGGRRRSSDFDSAHGEGSPSGAARPPGQGDAALASMIYAGTTRGDRRVEPRASSGIAAQPPGHPKRVSPDNDSAQMRRVGTSGTTLRDGSGAGDTPQHHRGESALGPGTPTSSPGALPQPPCVSRGALPAVGSAESAGMGPKWTGEGPAGSVFSVPGPDAMSTDPQAMLGGNLAMAASLMSPAEFDDFVSGEPPLRRLHLRAMFRARLLAGSSAFAYCMLGIILANTVVLAMEYDGMSSGYVGALRNANYVFTALFTLEMAIKLVGLGVWDYVTDGVNLFDAAIVAISWAEIILTAMGLGSKLNGMAALRAFRVLRLLKAFRYLGPLRRIAPLLLSTASSFAAIAVLIALFWVVFSIVGMHVFGGLELMRGAYPNFDTFLNSLVTTFNVGAKWERAALLTLENYQANMYDTIRASNYGAAAFYVAWIVFGKYILLTLFLAVTLEAFESKHESQGTNSSWTSQMRSAMGSAVESARPAAAADSRVMSRQGSALVANSAAGGASADENAAAGAGGDDGGASATAPRRHTHGRKCMQLPEGAEQDGCAPGERPTAGGGAEGKPTAAAAAAALLSAPTADSLEPSVRESQATSASPGEAGDGRRESRSGEGAEPSGHHHKHHHARIPLEGKSLFLVDSSNRLRRRTYRLVYGRPFVYTLFAIIIINCGIMALEGPHVREGSHLEWFLFWGNAACTIIFAVEVLVKVFAWTFVRYIKDVTNQVDFLVVITGLVELALTASQVQAVAALRVLRTLRPLRLLTRSPGMRLVFKSVMLSLGVMAHVSVVCVMFLLIFAILGVQLFSGKLYSCNDRSVYGRVECAGSFVDPLTGAIRQRSWDNMWPNFDNVGNALLASFVVASCNGYAELMRATMSARSDPDRQPRLNANPGAFFWFVGFIVIVSFTLLNLYVGVIFSQFSRIRNMSTHGSAFLTSNQQEWVELSKMVFRLRPPEKDSLPHGRWRLLVYRLVQGPAFERMLLGVIAVNVTVLAATWYGEPQEVTEWQTRLSVAFTAIYALEAALKLFGLGRRRYFKDRWNRFDFALLVVGLVDVALSALHWGFLRILRIFRPQQLLNVVRLVRRSKDIRSLFQALVMSLPAFGNVGSLIGLFLFMYAYVGVILFGRVVHNDNRPINDSANFSNFLFALSALFRVATGDNWTDIMYGCMLQPPDCDRSSGNCGSWLAMPYFLTFFLLIAIIMLNLFTAVIIENFEKTHEQDAWRLTPQNLEDFVVLWAEYDDGSGSIDPRALEELLLRLDPPLGLGPHAHNKEVLRFVYDLDIPLVDGRVPFHKTAFELVKRISQTEIPEGQLKAQLEALTQAFFQGLGSNHMDEHMHFSVAISAMLIQRRWRMRMRAARMRKKREWRESRRGAPRYTALLGAAGVAPAGTGGDGGDGTVGWRDAAAPGAVSGVAEAYRRELAAAATEAKRAAAAEAAGLAAGG
ncbi:hypothetical protein GPECTOR_4g931 [Gonium pectorale]|uniref:Ion transport domain-containing protein n=1 Tax=Gonium pectorale TaxID=33097 RepID=A0A150GYE1_GONPE|nr:hypothetical protein GPECTOR_4g931 [Gonium pectorale]|eukprot:KXZ54859.1 hypothetical protein GPECTOR_4g931 [Gonium pectorale]